MILDPNGMPILQPAIDNAETATFNTAFSAIGTAFTTLTGTRQIQTFSWADAAGRTGQTGVAAGDEGYQVDTDTAYRYDGAAWIAVGSVPDTGWITPTLTNGTKVPGGDFGYRRLGVAGAAVVYLRGRITSLSPSDVMFTLPYGYRPDAGVDNVLLLDGASTRVNLESSGKITILSSTASVTFTGVSFIANY